MKSPGPVTVSLETVVKKGAMTMHMNFSHDKKYSYETFECDVVKNLIMETQGEIYNLAYKMNFDMSWFSEQYLKSVFCEKEMDAIYSKFQTEFPEACMEELLSEWDNKKIAIVCRKEDAIDAYTSPTRIGQIYRYLFYELCLPSKELQHILPYSEIANYDIEFDTLEIENIVSFIMEDYQDEIQKFHEK